MSLAVVRGFIDRCILLNYRVDRAAAERLVPAPFRLRTWGDDGLLTISLMRIRDLRPRFLPAACGVTSENAACSIAVQWEEKEQRHEGLLALRQETSSRLNTLLTSRLLFATHHHAKFQVEEADQRFHITVDSDDQQTHLEVIATLAPELPTGGLFRSLAEAAEFFRRATRVAAASKLGTFEGLELQSAAWRPQPLFVHKLDCSYLEDRQQFPAGSLNADSALLLRHVEHRWARQFAIPCEPAAV